MAISSFRDLTVWQKSFQLVIAVYDLAQQIPKSEQFGITSQMQRAAVSIPSNIAEGQQRHNIKEYRQFIGVAKGSAAELETQLLLTSKLYGISVEKAIADLNEIQKMLHVLSSRLQPVT